MKTVPQRSEIEEAIKIAKWDRGSYEYALNAMIPHRFFNDSSIYKKSEIIEIFYKAIETKWNLISGFTTFKNLKN